MSTPDENKKPTGSKYSSMSPEDANKACQDDEMSRQGGDLQHVPEPARFIAGNDTWKQGLHIAKLEPDVDKDRQGGFTWLGIDYFGSEDQSGGVLSRALDAVKYSKLREPSFEHRLYRMSFKHGVQRLV